MRLSDLIDEECLVPELQATDRNGVIRELVKALADRGHIPKEHAETVAKAAISRENQGSTGFGKGVAVPHVKHEAMQKMAATIGRSSHGVDFAALDRAPVYTVVMLLSPSSAPEGHLAADRQWADPGRRGIAPGEGGRCPVVPGRSGCGHA